MDTPRWCHVRQTVSLKKMFSGRKGKGGSRSEIKYARRGLEVYNPAKTGRAYYFTSHGGKIRNVRKFGGGFWHFWPPGRPMFDRLRSAGVNQRVARRNATQRKRKRSNIGRQGPKVETERFKINFAIFRGSKNKFSPPLRGGFGLPDLREKNKPVVVQVAQSLTAIGCNTEQRSREWNHCVSP